MEEPVPERHLCIHENAQHDFCTYLCPYDLNQLHLAQEDMQYIDVSDVLDFLDVMLPADDDMTSLEDILKLWRLCWRWFINLLDTNIMNTCDILTFQIYIMMSFIPYLKVLQ